MRYLILATCFAFLAACGGSEAPQASNAATEPAAKTDDVLFQDQRTALQKAKGVEGMLLDADQRQRAQMEAQE
jgi:hypothetical protein